MLVDDHAVLRAGLANVLSLDPQFCIVAEADDGETAIALWRQHRPDVTLLDLSLPGQDGLETLRQLRVESPKACVLILSSSEAAEDARHALQAGAAGYMTKNLRAPELVTAIRKVHAGGQAFSASIEQRLAEQTEGGHLSVREVEVLGGVRRGFTNPEIGRQLGITERTVRFHIETIMRKLGATDRAAAVARGFEIGVLKV